MRRIYARSNLKKTVKGKKRLNLSKSADLVMYLSVILALERLSKAALVKSKETKEKVTTKSHIKLVFKDVLASLKG